MTFRKTLLPALAVACLLWTAGVAQAHQPSEKTIDLTIDGQLNFDPSGLFLLEGDLFLSGGRLDGQLVGRYDDISVPSINPDCDPVAAAALGFNAAEGVATFTFEFFGYTIGSITTEYQSCVVSTDFTTGELHVESAGTIVGGTGIFRHAQGSFDSAATISLITFEIDVDVSLKLDRD